MRAAVSKINLDRCVIGPQVRVGHDSSHCTFGGWPWGLRRDPRAGAPSLALTLARLLLARWGHGCPGETRSGPESWLLNRQTFLCRPSDEDERVLDPAFERLMV